jgi:WD40 repeat protein
MSRLLQIMALAAISSDRLLSGGCEKAIRLWDLNTWRELAFLEGRHGLVNALAVLPDGRIGSGSSDKTVRLRDSATGRELVRFQIDAEVKALTILSDGRVAAGDALGLVHLLAIKGEFSARPPAAPLPRSPPSAPAITAPAAVYR